MQKLNLLLVDGYYQSDFIVIDDVYPKDTLWTADLVGDGYYKAQYQGFTKNEETGECTGGEWAETGSPPPIDNVAIAESEKTNLLSIVSSLIAPLQDAVDLDMASEEEEARLIQLKKYRVLLNRVDTSKAPDIEWPVKPEGV